MSPQELSRLDDIVKVILLCEEKVSSLGVNSYSRPLCYGQSIILTNNFCLHYSGI